jgi:hypothetical protein
MEAFFGSAESFDWKDTGFHRPACALGALDRPISVSRAATSFGEGVVRLQRQ